MYQHVSRAHLAAAQLVHRHVVSPPWTAHLRGLCIALALMMMVHLAWFVHVDYGLPGDDAFFGKAGASPCRGDVDSATGLPRIVVVATLKPFSADPESKLRQLNAINSWRRSYPAARIFLVGETAASVAKEWGVVRCGGGGGEPALTRSRLRRKRCMASKSRPSQRPSCRR